MLLSCKKEGNNADCSSLNGPPDYHNEWSKSEEGRYHIISLMCEIKKIMQTILYTRQKQTHRHREQTFGYQGKREGIS